MTTRNKSPSLVERIYCYLYSDIMKTPSRDMPHVTISVLFALTVVIHSMIALLVVAKLLGVHINSEIGKVIVSVGCALLMIGSYSYFVAKKNGERIVEEFKDIVANRDSARFGSLIFIEMFISPFFAAAVIRPVVESIAAFLHG